MQARCICADQRHDIPTAAWHRAYCRWYDHDRAGRRVRATVWGFIADRFCRLNDRLGLWSLA